MTNIKPINHAIIKAQKRFDKIKDYKLCVDNDVCPKCANDLVLSTCYFLSLKICTNKDCGFKYSV